MVLSNLLVSYFDGKVDERVFFFKSQMPVLGLILIWICNDCRRTRRLRARAHSAFLLNAEHFLMAESLL